MYLHNKRDIRNITSLKDNVRKRLRAFSGKGTARSKERKKKYKVTLKNNVFTLAQVSINLLLHQLAEEEHLRLWMRFSTRRSPAAHLTRKILKPQEENLNADRTSRSAMTFRKKQKNKQS